MAMTADSSTNHHSPRGGDGDGVNSPHVPSKNLPSPWVQVVRGELDSVPASSKPQSPPSPQQSDSPSGQAPVPEQSSSSPSRLAEELHAVAGISEPEPHIGNAAPSRPNKQAWSKPPLSDAATAVTSDAGPLISDDVSWPELSKAATARPVLKAVSADSFSRAIPEGSNSNSQAAAATVTNISKKNAHSSNNKQNSMPPACHRQNKQRVSGGCHPHTPPAKPIPPRHPPVQPIPPPHPHVQPIPLPHPPVQPIPPPHPPVQPIPPPHPPVQPIPLPHPSVLPIPPASPPPPPFPIIPVPPNAYPNLLPTHVGPAIREPHAGWEGRAVGGFPSQPRPVNDHRNSSWRGSFVPNGHGEGQRDRGDYGSGRDVTAQSHRANSRSYVRSPAPADCPSQFLHPPAGRPFVRVPYNDMGHLYYPAVPMAPFRGGMIYPNGPPVPMFIPAVEPLHISLVYQIEYYFSDDNLAKDEFLKSNMDNEGWVPISLIANFPRVKGMTGGNHQLILNCLKVSTVVEVQDEKVRRRKEWMKWIRAPAPVSSVGSSPTPAESSQNALTASIQDTSANLSSTITQEDHVEQSKGYSESSHS